MVTLLCYGDQLVSDVAKCRGWLPVSPFCAQVDIMFRCSSRNMTVLTLTSIDFLKIATYFHLNFKRSYISYTNSVFDDFYIHEIISKRSKTLLHYIFLYNISQFKETPCFILFTCLISIYISRNNTCYVKQVL